jgi:hypothetical protein
MRTHHLAGLVAVLLVAFGAKLIFFPLPVATAGANAAPRMDVSRMHENKALPEQAMRDMSFVYAD